MVTFMKSSKTLIQLSTMELTAVIKLAEAELEKRKKKGDLVMPGEYAFDAELHICGSLKRDEGTKVYPDFKLATYLKAAILRRAMTMSYPLEWLSDLVSMKGLMGLAIKDGADKMLQQDPLVLPEMLEMFNTAETHGKLLFQSITPETPRAGKTTVTGTLSLLKKEKPADGN